MNDHNDNAPEIKQDGRRHRKTAPREVTNCPHTNRKHYARGYCASCYVKARLDGAFDTPRCCNCANGASGGSLFCRPCGDKPGYLGLPFRFWHYVIVVNDVPSSDPCWIWTGGLSGPTTRGRKQAASFSLNDVMVKAHRLTFEAAAGRTLDDVTTHTCKQTLCVNPSHIIETDLRSAIDNQRRLPVSGHRGVGTVTNAAVFKARGRLPGGNVMHLGHFETAEEANAAYRAFVDRVRLREVAE